MRGYQFRTRSLYKAVGVDADELRAIADAAISSALAPEIEIVAVHDPSDEEIVQILNEFSAELELQELTTGPNQLLEKAFFLSSPGTYE